MCFSGKKRLVLRKIESGLRNEQSFLLRVVLVPSACAIMHINIKDLLES